MCMTTALIDDFTEELLFEDELAPKTVHDVLVVLHGILKYTAACFSGGFPGIDLNYPKPCKKEMRVLSREEQARFVSYLLEDMDSCKFGVLLTLFTGIRIGELCALRWSNLSVKEQTIRIDAGEKVGKFTPETVNSLVRINGTLNEERIDEAFLSQWEEQAKAQAAAQHGTAGSSCESDQKARGETPVNSVEERISNFRKRIAERQAKEGKNYLSFYSVTADSYEIL